MGAPNLKSRATGRTLLAIYLGMAPVYWLPGVPVSLWAAAKLVIFGVAFGLFFLDSLNRKRLRVSRGMLGPIGFLLIVASAIPGLMHQGLGEVLKVVETYLTIYLAIWMGARVGEDRDSSLRLLRVALFTTAIFSTAWLLLLAIGANITSPPSMRSLPLNLSGFGAGRTGWSNGLAMATAVAFSLAAISRFTKNGKEFKFFVLIGSALFLSQVAVAGRAGILASLLSLGVASIIWRRGSAVPLIAALATILLAVWLFDPAASGREGRFDLTTSGGVEGLDALSAGRITTMRIALKEISERPLSGHGFADWEQNEAWGSYFVHNIWLKFAYQGGIFHLAANLLLFVGIIRRAVSALRIGPTPERAATICVFSALLISMLEANFPVGTFQTSALLWVVTGMLLTWGRVERLGNGL